LELFASLHESERAELARALIFTPFTAGETIMRQGNVAHHLYILESGRVEIRVTVDGNQKAVAQLGARTYVGEMGLMTGEARAASVVAVTDVVCLRLDKAAFDNVLKARPEIAAEVSEVLARRRVELDMAREEFDTEVRRLRMARERQRILAGIRGFFGLDE
jgi:CRP-like cAMP-binding protein